MRKLLLPLTVEPLDITAVFFPLIQREPIEANLLSEQPRIKV